MKNLLLLLCLLAQFSSFSQTPVATHLDNSLGFEFLDNQLLVAERSKNQIAIFDLDSGSTLKVDSITGIYQPHDVVLVDGALYVAQSKAIVKVELSVSPPMISTVATSIHNISGLTHHGDFLYFVESNTHPVYFGNMISRLNLNSFGKTAVTSWTDLFDIKYSGIAFDGDQVYVADFAQERIMRGTMDDTFPLHLEEFIANPQFEGVHRLAVKDRHLYFTTSHANRFWKVKISDPSNTLTEIISEVDYPTYFKFVGDDIYLSVSGEGKVIKIADVLTSTPAAIAVDAPPSIYPNPAADHLYVTPLKQETPFRIVDLLGQELMNGRVAQGERINIAALAAGTYFVQLGDGKPVKMIKTIGE